MVYGLVIRFKKLEKIKSKDVQKDIIHTQCHKHIKNIPLVVLILA